MTKSFPSVPQIHQALRHVGISSPFSSSDSLTKFMVSIRATSAKLKGSVKKKSAALSASPLSTPFAVTRPQPPPFVSAQSKGSEDPTAEYTDERNTTIMCVIAYCVGSYYLSFSSFLRFISSSPGFTDTLGFSSSSHHFSPTSVDNIPPSALPQINTIPFPSISSKVGSCHSFISNIDSSDEYAQGNVGEAHEGFVKFYHSSVRLRPLT